MISHRPTMILMVLVAGLICSAYFFQSADQLFQTAVYQEEVEGNLKGAIETYQTILSRFPDDRALGAKALLRIGLCREKLGLREARDAYQRIVDQYADQRQEVAVARERIAELSKTLPAEPGRPKLTEIRMPVQLTLSMAPRLSPDGRKIAYALRGEIWIVPVSGNVSPDLAGVPEKLPGVTEAENPIAWSGDGQWLAYSHLVPDARNPQYAGMCIVPASGGTPINLPFKRYAGIKGSISLALALSPSGDRVAFSHREPEQLKDFICLAPVRGGDAVRMTEGSEPAFSPDGQKIAFTRAAYARAPDGKYETDVWVKPARGGTPAQVSNVPGRADSPVWSPDGTMLVFKVRPSGGGLIKMYIATLPKQGTSAPQSTLIDLPLEPRNLTGWTTQGRIGVVGSTPVHYELYTVPAEGGQSAQITEIDEDEVYLLYPRWSPDGSRIFFQKNLGIASVPSEGGKEADVPIQWDGLFEGMPGGENDVSPDGRAVVFMGAREVSTPGRAGVMSPTHMLDIYSVPVEGGAPRRLTTTGNNSHPRWSPDGRSVAFVGFEGSPDDRRANLYTMPAEGGTPTMVTSSEDKVVFFGASVAWSPEGRFLAYFSADNAINIIPSTGGTPRSIAKVDQVTNHSDLSWSPDGKEIAYVSRDSIWAAPVDGGSARRILTGVGARPNQLSWSPDGKKIAFAAARGGNTGLWLVRDFLPLVRR